MEERLSLSFQRPIYVPAEPSFPLPAREPDEEPLALNLAPKARVARN